MRDLILKTQNELLINPRLPQSEQDTLKELYHYFCENYASQGYYVIASSGSSQQLNESVKLVAVHFEKVLNSARRVNRLLNAKDADSWALVLPDFHIAGLSVYARAHLSGSKVFQAEWKEINFADFIRSKQISFSSVVPAQVEDIIQGQVQSPDGFKCLFVGGGALTDGQREKLKHLGWPFRETFGMTETASMIAVRSAEKNLFEVLDGVSVEAVPPNGTLQINCDSLLSATIQKRNGKIELKDFSKATFFVTDDLVRLSNEGDKLYIEFLGRKHDYIKILGEGVSLLELKERLNEVVTTTQGLFGLTDLTVSRFEIVALEDARAGHLLYLVTDIKKNHDFCAAIKNKFNLLCRPFERITDLLVVEVFPRTDLGKLKLGELKSKIKELTHSKG